MFKVIKLIIAGVIVSFYCLLCSCSSVCTHRVEFFEKFCISPKDGYVYKTCKDVEVQIDDLDITVPKGFETDLASIPKWYWSILSPNNTKLVAPAILHDYLYSCNYDYSREHVDEIFYYALINNGVPTRTALTMYWTVRTFGGDHFHPEVNCTIAAVFE